jgi:hypothetical protein
MGKRGFEIYQYVAPALLTPLSFWLWWRAYGGDLRLTLMAWLVPIVYAYIVPGVGTNVLKVWEFDTRLRLGRFRPHHGFVFGSTTAALAWLSHPGRAHDLSGMVLTGLLFATVLGVCNIAYDIKAVRSGMLKVYNQPWAEGRSARHIVMDYAPWFFAGFGAVYGAGLAAAERLAGGGRLDWSTFAWLFPAVLGLCMLVPVLGYRRQSLRRHGHSGCRPVQRAVP